MLLGVTGLSVRRRVGWPWMVSSVLLCVSVGNERQRADRRRLRFAADHQMQAHARRGEITPHIAHRDGRVQRGRESARGDPVPASVPSSATISVPRPGRRAALGAQADAQARRTVLKLVVYHGRPGEISRLAALARNDPGQPGFHGGRQFINVVAIEAESGLQPQRIPCAEPSRNNAFACRSACLPIGCRFRTGQRSRTRLPPV